MGLQQLDGDDFHALGSVVKGPLENALAFLTTTEMESRMVMNHL